MPEGELNTDGAGSGGASNTVRSGASYRDARNKAAREYTDSSSEGWPPQHSDRDARGEAIDNHNLGTYADGKGK